MEYRQFLVGYGSLGDFARFRPCYSLRCQRGDRVVVRTSHGLELGTVLCEATPGHAHFLPNTTVGELVRPATARDEEVAMRLAAQARAVFAAARLLAEELNLDLEVLDAEVLLDGKHARLHYLGPGTTDPRPLMDALTDRLGVFVTLHNLNVAAVEEPAGCGAADCGGGNCGSCGSGGCGSCNPATPQSEPHRVALL